jgi:hypothetical protein
MPPLAAKAGTSEWTAQVVMSYMFVSTDAEWFDAWMSDGAGDVIGELHAMRAPNPVNMGTPAFGWWEVSDHESFEPDYFAVTNPVTLNGWCDTSGTRMLPYGTLYSR